MKASESITELATALTTFQSKMPTLPKDSSGYGYKYASHGALVEAIKEPLAAAGLSYVQLPGTPPVEYGTAVALTTRLMHITGEWVEDTMIMPVPQVGKANDAQNYGAALTYARRYALSSMLGIAADEDVDAAPRPRPQPSRPAPAPTFEELPSANPKANGNGVTEDQFKPTEKQQKALFAMGKKAYGDEWDEKRAELVNHVTNGRSESAKHLTRKEISTLLDGISKKLEAA